MNLSRWIHTLLGGSDIYLCPDNAAFLFLWQKENQSSDHNLLPVSLFEKIAYCTFYKGRPFMQLTLLTPLTFFFSVLQVDHAASET